MILKLSLFAVIIEFLVCIAQSFFCIEDYQHLSFWTQDISGIGIRTLTILGSHTSANPITLETKRESMRRNRIIKNYLERASLLLLVSSSSQRIMTNKVLLPRRCSTYDNSTSIGDEEKRIRVIHKLRWQDFENICPSSPFDESLLPKVM